MGRLTNEIGQSSKKTTNTKRQLDIRRLQREGLLIPGQKFKWTSPSNHEEVGFIQLSTDANHMLLSYCLRSHGEWQLTEYPVSLDWTSCNLGGRRAWFFCPVQRCGRRVAILFGGAMLACRHCHQLAYVSQRETVGGRAARQANAIRRRLGWDIGILNPVGGKPKGMHWRTFWRLKAEYDTFVNTSLAGMAKRLEQMKNPLTKVEELLNRTN